MAGFEISTNNLPVLAVVVPLIAGFLTPIVGWIQCL